MPFALRRSFCQWLKVRQTTTGWIDAQWLYDITTIGLSTQLDACFMGYTITAHVLYCNGYKWGRVMHTCVSKLTIISPDGLSPGRRQAIIRNNAGILLIRTLGTNVKKIFNETHTFLFKIMHLKMSSAKWRQFCLGLNVFTKCLLIITQRLWITLSIIYHSISHPMMTSINGNIFRVTCHLCGEFTGHRWIPHKKVIDAGLWYCRWSAPAWTIE